MHDIATIQGVLRGHALVREVDQLAKGHLRIETALHYPDGTSIEVYLVNDQSLFPGHRLSDLGQTTSWLLDVQVKPWLSKKRQALLDDALHTYGVRKNGGALELDIPSLESLIDGVVRLGQACLRASDLIFTRRSSLAASFNEDLEEVIADTELQYESGLEIPGKFQKLVRVDYRVVGTRSKSLVLGWSAMNSTLAHAAGNEIFRKWFDLSIPERTEQRVTIWDDRTDVYKDEDLERLRVYSSLLALSEREAIRDLLAA